MEQAQTENSKLRYEFYKGKFIYFYIVPIYLLIKINFPRARNVFLVKQRLYILITALLENNKLTTPFDM